MRISGTEPSSVILSQNKEVLKVESAKKQTEAKKDGVINPHNYEIPVNFEHGKF